MDLIEKAYSFTKLWISVIVAIIYFVLLVLYQHYIQGLKKPAGMQEALVFLFNYPKDYFGALILGLVIHAICVAMIICWSIMFNIMFYRNCDIESSAECGYDDKFRHDNNNDCTQ